MQSDFSCCLSFIQIHVHLQGVILSLLTFYFRSGLSSVRDGWNVHRMTWKYMSSMITHQQKNYNFRWGCPQFYYKLKTFIIEFLDKMRGSFYTHMSCTRSYLPLYTLFFSFRNWIQMKCIVHVYQISIKVAVIEVVDMSRLFKINTVFRWGFFLYERIV